MINSYDFDKTIYDGDSSIDFYVYCLKRKKSIFFLLPIQVFAIILYKIRIKNKEYMKEKFFSFLNRIDNIDDYVNDFWNKNYKKMKKWYLDQKKNSDVIISASPEFLLKPLENKLNIDKVIATKVDKKTGKFLSENCYGEEKVLRFKNEYKNKTINAFYSDSMSDKPMMNISKKAYLVKKDKLVELE